MLAISIIVTHQLDYGFSLMYHILSILYYAKLLSADCRLLGRVRAFDRHCNVVLENVREMWTEVCDRILLAVVLFPCLVCFAHS